jgi:diphthamide biosynthesis protein 3
MSSFYDEVDVEDMAFDAAQARFTHPCPCGDVFFISLADLLAGEEVARCASCSLRLKVLVGDFDALEARERQLKPVAEAVPAAAAAAQAQEQAAAEPAAPDGGAAPVNDAAATVTSSDTPADAAAAREPEPAADSLLGERFLDALCEVCAHGNCLDLHHARRVCGLSWRCANGVLTGRAGFLGQRAQLPPWGLVVGRAANLVARTAADSCEERHILSLLAACAPRRCERRTGPRRRRGRAEPSLARGRRRTE